MGKDMCVPCENGLINLRVGAIIMKDGQILMVGNKRSPAYLYSVGGRIQFGETAEEAIRREVREETGVDMEVDRLGFVHENYFYGDAPIFRDVEQRKKSGFEENLKIDTVDVVEYCKNKVLDKNCNIYKQDKNCEAII